MAAVLGAIVPVRIWFITEYAPPTFGDLSKKARPGLRPGPAKGRGLWKPFVFDDCDGPGMNVMTVDVGRHVGRAIRGR